MNNSSVQAAFQPFTLPFSIIAAAICAFGIFDNGMFFIKDDCLPGWMQRCIQPARHVAVYVFLVFVRIQIMVNASICSPCRIASHHVRSVDCSRWCHFGRLHPVRAILYATDGIHRQFTRLLDLFEHFHLCQRCYHLFGDTAQGDEIGCVYLGKNGPVPGATHFLTKYYGSMVTEQAVGGKHSRKVATSIDENQGKPDSLIRICAENINTGTLYRLRWRGKINSRKEQTAHITVIVHNHVHLLVDLVRYRDHTQSYHCHWCVPNGVPNSSPIF
ncbi:unnamed protein product [Sphagnum balticum]